MPAQDKRRRVAHTCPLCGMVRQLKPYDAARTTHCRHCHCQQIAPLGFAATADKLGRDFAIRAAAMNRKAHPSSLEAKVEAALRALPGITWEREVAVERVENAPYYVDFVVIASRRIALEVNGSYAHRHDPPERQAERMKTLHLHFDAVIVLTQSQMKQTPDLTAFLAMLLV
jgi:hypothetical protein